jgi:glycine oxidase
MSLLSSSSAGRDRRIAVIGAGVIGLSCALALRRRGAAVSVYDQFPAAGEGTSARAGGMLAPAYETARGEGGEALFTFAARSAALWPLFVADIEQFGGGACEADVSGSLACAFSAAETQALEGLAQACDRRGVRVERLSAREVRVREPLLAEDVTAGLELPGDGQVDAARLVLRLAHAVRALGGDLVVSRPVDRIVCGREFRLPDGALFDQVLLTTGFSSAAVRFEAPDGAVLDPGAPRLRPVKGQMLALAAGPLAPRRVVRFGSGYVAPKTRWTLVGSTSEPGVEDLTVDGEAIDRLHARLLRVLPGLSGVPRLMSWAGVRPSTGDEAPAIGALGVPGLFAALGHYRNGVLLAPATAEMVSALMIDASVDELSGAFSPGRPALRDMASHSPTAP